MATETLRHREKRLNRITHGIIGAAIDVHKELGPGLLEGIYEECLCDEFERRGVGYDRQVAVPVKYKGRVLPVSYRLDLVVEKQVVVELKAIDAIHDVHLAQLLCYLRITGHPLGLLLNFNEARLVEGVYRVVGRNAALGPSGRGPVRRRWGRRTR